MFKGFFEVWTKGGLLGESFKDIDVMFGKCRKIFVLALDDLVKNKVNEVDKINDLEKKIDDFTRGTRRKIIEYLAINNNPNINAALVLGQTLSDLERIGDISREILKLDLMYDQKLSESDFLSAYRGLEEVVLWEFDAAREAFMKADKEKANAVIRKHDEVKARYDEMFKRIWDGESKINQETIIYVLVFRYFNRVSAHLMNISTSVVKPYTDMGYSK